MVFKCFSAPNTVEASWHSHRGYPVFTAAISIVRAHPIATRFKKRATGIQTMLLMSLRIIKYVFNLTQFLCILIC